MADLRQACDRCHDKKLRCPKQPGSLICSRCAKATVPCIFSPPTRSLLRNGTVGDSQQPDLAAFDWSSLLEFDQVCNNSPNGDAVQSANPFVTTPPVSDNADTPSLSNTSELANLMVSLDRIHSDFPLSYIHRHMSVEMVKQISQSAAARFDMQSTIELLLQQGQQLALLYPPVLKKAHRHVNRPPEDSQCTISDCMHHLRQSLRPRSPPILDHSLLNLLIACHLRLLDIFDNLMDHSRVCAHVFSTLPKDSEPNFDIPEIRIGSFVAPRDSAATIMITMLVELHSSLEARCQEMSEMVISAAGETSLESRALSLQCEALALRSVGTLADMKGLRTKLFSSGILG
ncbi:hypothetical protein BGZ61DRAFT_434685 [Ilyonectria robusta]|uniref:uncharacterized protein n=1 Tax=Ilyonectria robusta TaxID=1079257 RepID=UPI001E8DB264|nr:uncharacterized protein BGZ61DRAFT_434685 [Ilyonectria robusta]KAH8655929.1 hypothetical protein BGZ61DRAFT_434685 [Ilyonectria robusta]